MCFLSANYCYYHVIFWGEGEGKYGVYCRTKQRRQAVYAQKIQAPQRLSGKRFFFFFFFLGIWLSFSIAILFFEIIFKVFFEV